MHDIPDTEQRLLIRVELEPLVGSTFQPTGFPDLGAAEFDRPIAGGSERALLVESVQSMTNHLEEQSWDGVAGGPAEPLAGLPYVRVEDESGELLASSRTEPHRLASAYIKDADFDGRSGVEWISGRLGLVERRPTIWQSIYESVFEMDPMCLIHGVFFSDKRWNTSGNPKVRRVTTAVIEAHGVERVVSGGLKRDDVQFTAGEGAGAEQGYGFVPFGRTEYAARSIELTVAIDLGQIRGYGLGEEATVLLTDIAMWEVASMLERPLRLRTACDLAQRALAVERPADFAMPSSTELAERIASTPVEFESPGAWTAIWKAGAKKA